MMDHFKEDIVSPRAKVLSNVLYVLCWVFIVLFGGYARLRGKGEFFTPFDGPEGKVLVSGFGSVDTASCFERFDLLGGQGFKCDNDVLVRELESRSFNDCGKLFNNALFDAAQSLNPHVGRIYDIMRASGLDACMTGSGACVFGIGDDKELRAAETALNEHGYRSDIINIVKKGCEIV